MNSNVLLIVNPVAGRKKAKSMLYRVVDSLCRNGYIVTIFTTARKGEATDIVIEHAKTYDKIICCGGDGTLNEVFTGLIKAGLSIPVGYIPSGTTNDLAAALKLPLNIKEAVEVTENGKIRQHDIGKFNENQYFSYVASFGAFTKVSYKTPQWLKNLFGRIAYIFKGVFSIADIHPQTAKVTADGREIKGDFIYGSVSNSTVIGGIIKLSESEVFFDDGMFEVILIKNPQTPKNLKKILKGIIKNCYDDEYIYRFKAGKIAFSFENSTEWCIDGEYAGTLDTVNIENLHGMVQIVT